MSDAAQITRNSKSNLAFALRILPPDRREDMVGFYAFCRVLDDLADDPSQPSEQRAHALQNWKHGLLHGFENPDPLQRQILEIRDRRNIPNELLVAIADGCLMDLQPQRFQTWDALSNYIWKVACAVGLVSIRLFGCKDPGAETYAIALGRALQLTNILRDIREDYDNGARVYLPLDELARFGYSEADLANHTHDNRFLALMEFQAARAESYFREAAAALPAADHRALTPARIMAEIYQALLDDMKRGKFDVFKKRHHVSRMRKLAILLKHLIAGRP